METTLVGCPPPVMRFEQAVQWVLLDGDRVLSYTVQDNKPTLIGDRGRLIYRATPLVRAT